MDKIDKIIRNVAITLAVLIVADLVAGFFLMRYAIARKADGEETPEPEYSISLEGKIIIMENKERLTALSSEWMNTAGAKEIQIAADDGEIIKGDLVTSKEGSHQWVLLLHGYSRTRSRLYSYGMYYAQKGYNVIMPDMRAHGESGGNYIGMGWLDRRDIVHWIELIVSMDFDAQIVVHGISMGASAAIMTSGEKVPDNLKAIIADCAYTGVWDVFQHVLSERVSFLSYPLVATADLFATFLAGYSFSGASCLEAVKKATVPIMFIQGDKDTLVGTDTANKLFSACPTTKNIIMVEDAAHGQAFYRDPDVYFDAVLGFAQSQFK